MPLNDEVVREYVNRFRNIAIICEKTPTDYNYQLLRIAHFSGIREAVPVRNLGIPVEAESSDVEKYLRLSTYAFQALARQSFRQELIRRDVVTSHMHLGRYAFDVLSCTASVQRRAMFRELDVEFDAIVNKLYQGPAINPYSEEQWTRAKEQFSANSVADRRNRRGNYERKKEE